MATSGTFIFNPDLAELVDEAMERCRIDPAKIEARHILSARRSMRFMLADWATEDYHDFRIKRLNFTTVDGTGSYTGPTNLPTNVVDIIDVALRRSGVDTPIEFMSRSDWLNLPAKTTEGRPDRVFVDKQRDGITVYFWPVPENSTDQIYFDAVLKFEDSDTASDNADIPYQMLDAFAGGLAARLAEKYSPPELEEKLWLKADRAFKRGTHAVRERGDVRIVPESGTRRRRGSAGRYR